MRNSTVVALFLVAGALGAQDPESTKSRERVARFVGTDYSYAYFHGDIDPWQLLALSAGDRGPRGTFIGRVNLARRFSQDGAQAELDAYPRFGERLYAYFNAGYSSGAPFPRWRSGAELFANLPHAWEASLGYRQLRFGAAPVTLFTGAVGKYIGNSWISARPYVRVRKSGVSASIGVTGRKYFADADNYVGARLSAGTGPSDEVDASSLSRTGSFAASVQGARSLPARLFVTWSAGVDNEQLSATRTRRQLIVSAGVRREF